MFAARHQDENAINTHQQAAAAKPLNASVRGLAPKTPANKLALKTPARGNKTDENSKLDFGKTGGGKEGKIDRNAFITPANNRVRAPLGNKTTNAKALQTPALQVPEEDKPKATSPRLRRSKIKIHESLDTAHDVLNKDPEEREIEYMPPREVPLKDEPDDILPYPMNMNVLKDKNLTRGWFTEYSGKVDNDEDSELSDFEEKMNKAKKEEEKRAKATKTAPNRPGKTAALPTVRAQNAASALGSKPTTKPAIPSFAAPTPMAKARLAGSIVPAGRKPAPVAGNPRFTAAKAASNSTIGYSKGRAVSASTRPTPSSIHARPPPAKREEPKQLSTLENLLQLGAMDLEGEDDDADMGLPVPNAVLNALLDDDDDEVFQLDPVGL